MESVIGPSQQMNRVAQDLYGFLDRVHACQTTYRRLFQSPRSREQSEWPREWLSFESQKKPLETWSESTR